MAKSSKSDFTVILFSEKKILERENKLGLNQTLAKHWGIVALSHDSIWTSNLLQERHVAFSIVKQLMEPLLCLIQTGPLCEATIF